MPLHHTPLRMAVWGFRNVFLTTDRWHRYYTRFRLKKILYKTRQAPLHCEYLVVTTSLVVNLNPNEKVHVATFYLFS